MYLQIRRKVGLFILNKKKIWIPCIVLIFLSYTLFVIIYNKFSRKINYTYYNQDESKIIYPKDLNIPESISQHFHLFELPFWDWPKYENYKTIDANAHEDYSIVEDEHGFQYRRYKCFQTAYSRWHFWRSIMYVWMEYCKKLDIEWYVYFGGLLAAGRDEGNPLIWDFDFDVIVNKKDVHKLLNHVPQELFKGTWYSFIHPQHSRKPLEREVFDCPFPKDKVTHDFCHFRNLVGRWIHTEPWGTRLDIYGFERKPNGEFFVEWVHDAGGPKKKPGHYYYQSQWERRDCEIVGLKMNCPKEMEEVLYQVYSDWKEVPYKCKDGDLVKREE